MSALAQSQLALEFRAMGTSFKIVCAGIDLALLNELKDSALLLESFWTRFNDKSELMLLNQRAGEKVLVSEETSRLIAEMRRGFILTDGLYNAGVLPQMIAQGFTATQSTFIPTSHSSSTFKELWNAVEIDEHAIFLPKGLAIDAGGIGKGLAADIIAEQAMRKGALGVVVNAGGEVAVRGESVIADGWSVGVENPFDEDDILTTVYLKNGGLATSAPSGWVNDKASHIIDPRTGESVSSSIAQATLLCARTVDAEVLAKMCLLLPIQESVKKVESLGAAAFVVDGNGNTYQTETWSDFE